ncbi:molybdate transport system substrate-binding protein [Rhizobium sp. SG_E_25_P2]|uniref:molybdate ABC transporter substrate-binding protein n=1 Tax=Rhizobium sp. SG_E_25_P2 TaxID=2879942 RepID=UPI0024738FA2|nr:molybdate ABC transporter substrate-binding protein [Rhizobium sp. SG_E_25_P2]MDH6266550.1 molybdate transport system substrate-binding protein [Rhizobium sp. SG_E_25_P2]
MERMLRRNVLSAFIAAMVAMAGGGAALAEQAKSLTVFAAASLKGSLDKAAQLYQSKTGVKVAISFAASSALAKQIEAGAPADLFLSADLKWMTYLVDKGAVNKEQVVKLLGNRLVLVGAPDFSKPLTIGQNFPLAEALGDGRIAMGEPKSVPAGKYGREALDYYGVWKAIEPKVAAADNVRAALQLVARGEAPLGIVYETDAKAEAGVKVVGVFPEESHAPIIYPIAPIAHATNPSTQDFLSFLTGAEAQAIFKQAGFTVLAGS